MKPCKSCPWRIGSTAAAIPGFQACMAQRLGQPGEVMGCHHSTDENPVPCAGWVVQVAQPAAWASGEQAVPMRLLVMRAGVRLGDYQPCDEPLHGTVDEMVDAIVASAVR